MSLNYKQKVLRVLENSEIPMDVQKIRRKAGIKSWVTGKTLLLELLYNGEISGQKTTKSWIFWKNEERGGK